MDTEVSLVSEIVSDVFRKWCNSDRPGVGHKGTDPYVEWLDNCHQGSELPARLTWIVCRCKRSPLRETMSAIFGMFDQKSSTASSFEDAQFWKKHAESLSIVDTLMEYVWEHFNSGHWKDTPPYWRRIYSWLSACKIVMLSIAPSVSPGEIVKVCDVALLTGTSQSQLTNIFSETATQLNRMLSSCSLGLEDRDLDQDQAQVHMSCNEALERSRCVFFSMKRLGHELGLPSENVPSLETFTNTYFQKRHPVLIKGGMSTWPALGKWSPRYIARVAGSRTVPVEIGSTYTAKDWTQKLMTIREFVNTYMSSAGPQAKEIGYLAQHQLLDQVPELKQDIEVPEYCLVGEKEDLEVNTWFGPAGTVTPTHFDAKHNILTQVFGAKLIILFPPSETRFLYPHNEGSLLFNTSQVNIEDPQECEAFPEALKASYYVIFLQAGDMLYIPPKYWHFVRSLSPSFSLSFWFE